MSCRSQNAGAALSSDRQKRSVSSNVALHLARRHGKIKMEKKNPQTRVVIWFWLEVERFRRHGNSQAVAPCRYHFQHLKGSLNDAAEEEE